MSEQSPSGQHTPTPEQIDWEGLKDPHFFRAEDVSRVSELFDPSPQDLTKPVPTLEELERIVDLATKVQYHPVDTEGHTVDPNAADKVMDMSVAGAEPWVITDKAERGRLSFFGNRLLTNEGELSVPFDKLSDESKEQIKAMQEAAKRETGVEISEVEAAKVLADNAVKRLRLSDALQGVHSRFKNVPDATTEATSSVPPKADQRGRPKNGRSSGKGQAATSGTQATSKSALPGKGPKGKPGAPKSKPASSTAAKPVQKPATAPSPMDMNKTVPLATGEASAADPSETVPIFPPSPAAEKYEDAYQKWQRAGSPKKDPTFNMLLRNAQVALAKELGVPIDQNFRDAVNAQWPKDGTAPMAQPDASGAAPVGNIDSASSVSPANTGTSEPAKTPEQAYTDPNTKRAPSSGGAGESGQLSPDQGKEQLEAKLKALDQKWLTVYEAGLAAGKRVRTDDDFSTSLRDLNIERRKLLAALNPDKTDPDNFFDLFREYQAAEIDSKEEFLNTKYGIYVENAVDEYVNTCKDQLNSGGDMRDSAFLARLGTLNDKIKNEVYDKARANNQEPMSSEVQAEGKRVIDDLNQQLGEAYQEAAGVPPQTPLEQSKTAFLDEYRRHLADGGKLKDKDFDNLTDSMWEDLVQQFKDDLTAQGIDPDSDEGRAKIVAFSKEMNGKVEEVIDQNPPQGWEGAKRRIKKIFGKANTQLASGAVKAASKAAEAAGDNGDKSKLGRRGKVIAWTAGAVILGYVAYKIGANIADAAGNAPSGTGGGAPRGGGGTPPPEVHHTPKPEVGTLSHYGDTVWEEVAKRNPDLQGHDLWEEVDKTLKVNNMTWEDAKHMQVGATFDFLPDQPAPSGGGSAAHEAAQHASSPNVETLPEYDSQTGAGTVSGATLEHLHDLNIDVPDSSAFNSLVGKVVEYNDHQGVFKAGDVRQLPVGQEVHFPPPEVLQEWVRKAIEESDKVKTS